MSHDQQGSPNMASRSEMRKQYNKITVRNQVLGHIQYPGLMAKLQWYFQQEDRGDNMVCNQQEDTGDNMVLQKAPHFQSNGVYIKMDCHLFVNNTLWNKSFLLISSDKQWYNKGVFSKFNTFHSKYAADIFICDVTITIISYS